MPGERPCPAAEHALPAPEEWAAAALRGARPSPALPRPPPPLTKMAPPGFPLRSCMAAGLTQRSSPALPRPRRPSPGAAPLIGPPRGAARRLAGGRRSGLAGPARGMLGVGGALAGAGPGAAWPRVCTQPPSRRAPSRLPRRQGGSSQRGQAAGRRGDAREGEARGRREAVRRSGCYSRRCRERNRKCRWWAVPVPSPRAARHPGGSRFSFPGAG